MSMARRAVALVVGAEEGIELAEPGEGSEVGLAFKELDRQASTALRPTTTQPALMSNVRARDVRSPQSSKRLPKLRDRARHRACVLLPRPHVGRHRATAMEGSRQAPRHRPKVHQPRPAAVRPLSDVMRGRTVHTRTRPEARRSSAVLLRASPDRVKARRNARLARVSPETPRAASLQARTDTVQVSAVQVRACTD
jgi:hypothetical protein